LAEVRERRRVVGIETSGLDRVEGARDSGAVAESVGGGGMQETRGRKGNYRTELDVGNRP
jgi:hypothetical protein